MLKKNAKIFYLLKVRKKRFSSSFLSPYEILGVDEGSDLKTIKANYFKLVNKYHPDKNKSNVD
jgi:curved DNA-binding protein CbpA